MIPINNLVIFLKNKVRHKINAKKNTLFEPQKFQKCFAVTFCPLTSPADEKELK